MLHTERASRELSGLCIDAMMRFKNEASPHAYSTTIYASEVSVVGTRPVGWTRVGWPLW